MRHGSLFSGIGGFDLAAEWMGWENVFHCEWNPFGQKVLKYYWPNAISYNDITKTDFTIHRGTIDILTGGFPCQPYSLAGKRLGKNDERHLWPEMLRAIREIKPRWIIGENVYGLVNWSEGLVFDEVQSELEAEGFEVFPYVLPAASVNAPHKRDRVWFVANANGSRYNRPQKSELCVKQNEHKYANNIGNESRDRIIANPTSDGYDDKSNTQNNRIGKNNQQSRPQRERTAEGFGNEWNATNTDSSGVQRQQINSGTSEEIRQRWQGVEKIRNFGYVGNWQNFPTVSPVCNGNDGLSSRLDSITFPKWRNESIKAGGNAVVPQVVYQLFKTIEAYKQHDRHTETKTED